MTTKKTTNSSKTKKISKRGSLRTAFLRLAVILCVIVIFAITIACYSNFHKVIFRNVEVELTNEAYTLLNALDRINPGEYSLTVQKNVMALYKGDSPIEQDFLDAIKEDTSLDISLIYIYTNEEGSTYGMRMLSTLVFEDSNISPIGSKLNGAIYKEVAVSDSAKFYDSVTIEDKDFAAYYMPLHNSDGDVRAILGVVKDSTAIKSDLLKAFIPIIVIALILITVMIVFVIFYSKEVTGDISAVRNFITAVGNGELDKASPDKARKRDDEIGDIASSAVMMQSKIRDLVEKDALTKLYNRRYGNTHLKKIAYECTGNDKPYSVVIGDIDFFKKFNDTYGHDAGDIVLIEVARCLGDYMVKYGFAARWGGEEFLLVFRNMDGKATVAAIENLIELVHAISITYNAENLTVNMSFGVADGRGQDIETTLIEADVNLYYSKEHGRDRVTYQ